MQLRKLFSLGFALALVESISFPAHADLLKNLKTDGSIEVKSFGIDNETDRDATKDDYRSEIRTRVFAGGTFDLLDDVHGRVLLRKNNRVYGGGGESIETIESTVFLDNAYAKIDKVFGRVDLTMGRQFYGSPNDFVIYFGPLPDDVLGVLALDAFRADADIAGVAKFQGIAGKTVDLASVGPGANTDIDLFGGEVNTDKVIPMGNLAFYYYTRKAKAVKPPAIGNNTLTVTGLRAAGDIIAGLGYKADWIQNFGRNNVAAGTPAYNGNAYFLGLHYGHTVSNMPLRAKLEYGRGSEDFTAIAPGQRFGKIWGEHTSLALPLTQPSTANRPNGTGAGLSNLKVIDAGVGINPIAKLGLDLNAYRFILDDGRFTGGKTSAGTEYDFVVSWKHSDNVSLEASAATFQVGDSLQNPTASTPTSTATAPVTRLGAEVKIKF